jgi:hypothetical protein
VKVYVTQCALTYGVQERDVYMDRDGKPTVNSGGGIAVYDAKRNRGHKQIHVHDWFLTREEAVERAEEMRLQAIQYFTEHLDKLKQRRFT